MTVINARYSHPVMIISIRFNGESDIFFGLADSHIISIFSEIWLVSCTLILCSFSSHLSCLKLRTESFFLSSNAWLL